MKPYERRSLKGSVSFENVLAYCTDCEEYGIRLYANGDYVQGSGVKI